MKLSNSARIGLGSLLLILVLIATKLFLPSQTEPNTPPNLTLNDIWALEAIKRKALTLEAAEFTGVVRPQLEVHLADKLIMGNNGCNGYFATISYIDAESIRLTQVGSTQKLCANMLIADQYLKQLGQVVAYKVHNLTLQLFDKAGEEVLRFRKID